jgi:hypothetical protein
MNALDDLRHIYQLYVERQGDRSLRIERELGVSSQELVSEDDRRNEPANFRRLFEAGESPAVMGLYQSLMRDMDGKNFHECTSELAGLQFAATIVMKAVMVYQASRTSELAKFSNAFDRLDLVEVRRKLWEMAQRT